MKEISLSQLCFNPMDMIAKEWMLVTAGNESRGYNTMTASWGHLGAIWGKGGGLPTAVYQGICGQGRAVYHQRIPRGV